jgi:L-ascorbate metabolism protein UlaG (beta-lactamase superfamily)
MRIKWLGHSCFKITSKSGIRIVTDPFDDNVGYKLPSVETDIVTVSHGHYDHNFIDCLTGDYDVVTKVGNFYVKDIPITGVHAYHDDVQGEKRGNNIVYVFEIDGMRLCHLGDIGHVLTPAQVEMIGKVDILLLPVGGVYTVSTEDALKIIELLRPSKIILMHFKTPALKFNLDPVDNFINAFKNTERLSSQVIEINKDDIKGEEPKAYILKYE